MQGSELRAIRERLGFTEPDGNGEAQFARELGYTGNFRNRVRQIKAFESGEKRVPQYIARLAWLLATIKRDAGAPDESLAYTYVDETGLVKWPHWTTYDAERNAHGEYD